MRLRRDDYKELLGGLSPLAKLVWLWVQKYPGEHSRRSIAEELELGEAAVGKAMRELLGRGLLLEEEQPKGQRPGKYRVGEGGSSDLG